MKRLAPLKYPLAAALLCAATYSGAAPVAGLTPAVERRGEPVAAPARSDAAGGHALAGVDGAPQTDRKNPEWMMLLAGLAVAGWIAQRRLGSPLE